MSDKDLQEAYGLRIPQYWNPDTNQYEVYQGAGGAQNVRDSRDLRGLSASKPLATDVIPGTTYWSVDTDPHAAAIEVSDGTSWVVI